MNKKKVLAIVLALTMVFSLIPASHKAANVQAASSNKRVVGYFPSYRTYAINSIDYSALTHCILSFMTYENGTLTSGFSGGDVQTIVNKCHSNGTKAMIAIGGWNGFNPSDNPFGTAQKRTNIVNQIINYVDTYNLDGVDLDLEVNDANVWNNFDAFVSELSGQLKARGKLLTMAVATWFTGPIANSTYQYFDFLNLMSYDYNQSGTGEVAPWSQIYDMISYYGSRGVSNDRMVIGVPFYGYSTSGAKTYAEMVSMNAAYADMDQAAGVYYNGMSTIRKKAEYSKSYGGTMIWEIAQDSFDSRYSLLQVIKSVMGTNNQAEQGTQPPATTKAPETTKKQETATGTWNSSTVYYGGDTVTYNGKTYRAQWWTQGETPGQASVWTLVGDAVEPTTKAPETTKPKETTTAAPSDGYTTANANWTELNYWSPYFASGWGGDPTGAYKDGNSYSNFALRVTKTGDGGAWGIQLKTQEMSLDAGAQYRCKVGVQTNVAVNSILFKEDKTAVESSKNLSVGNNSFELAFTADSTAQFVFDLAKAPTGFEMQITSFSVEKIVPETTTEPKTEAPTQEQTTEAPTKETTTEAKSEVKMEINGCQISTSYEGFRVVYSVSDTKNEVEHVGLVYGLEGYANDADMVVNSSNKTVYDYEAVAGGQLSSQYSNLPAANSYAMTMKFINSSVFFKTPIKVRAYAKLKNGEYVYTDIKSYTIYNVADYLYKNQLMNNIYGHDYLYNNILKKCNASYQKVSYNLDNTLVKF